MPALLVLLSLGNAVGMLLAGEELTFGNTELCTLPTESPTAGTPCQLPQGLALEGGFLGESPCCKLWSKQAQQTQIL